MDWTTIIVAVIAFLGTLVGSLAGIRESNKTVELRLERLEKKVELHNNLVERMTKVESHMALCDEKFKVANNRIKDLETFEHDVEIELRE